MKANAEVMENNNLYPAATTCYLREFFYANFILYKCLETTNMSL